MRAAGSCRPAAVTTPARFARHFFWLSSRLSVIVDFPLRLVREVADDGLDNEEELVAFQVARELLLAVHGAEIKDP